MKELAFFIVGALVASAIGHQKNKLKDLERQLEAQTRKNTSNNNQ